MIVAEPQDTPWAECHPQFPAVRRIIDDGSCSVLSFDIFDTMLWRRVPNPVDLFGVLAASLRRDGFCPEWVTDAAFRRLRQSAERDARARQGSLGTEVSLFDIWSAMPSALFAGLALEELVEAEVKIEVNYTVVDLGIAELIRSARKRDMQVVFVSDTYFTEDHLHRLLDRPELGSLEGVRIFRSNAYGRDKGSGLWPVVLSRLGCQPGEVVHIGDNPVADDEAPASLGIRTICYERIDEKFQVVLDRERDTTDAYHPFGSFTDPDEGDYGLTTLRARAVSTAPRTGDDRALTAWRYGAGVLGPVLTGFAEWVVDHARRSNTTVLWCPMREGELLSQLINAAASARGVDVEARTLWLSRHVTWLATIDRFDAESIENMLGRSYRATVRGLLASLGLRPGDVPSLASQLDSVLDGTDIVQHVALALTETPHLRNQLAVTATAKRERLVHALRRNGALDQPDMALVDLGWGGTIQLQLARALGLAGVDVVPSGLYLATDERSTRLLQAGLRSEGYLGQNGHPHEAVATIARSPEVIELAVNALCGSTVDFDDAGAPVLGPCAGSETQNLERKAVQAGIGAFQSRWNAYIGAANGRWPNLADPSARARLAEILRAALTAPTADEASLFGSWAHEDNLGSALVSHIMPTDLVRAIPYMSPNDLSDLNMRDAFWPSLIAAADPQLAAAASAVSAGHLEPAAFEPSGPASETRVKYRTHSDVWCDGPTQRVRINHNGLSFARLDLRPADIRDHPGGIIDVSVSLPGRPAIVRIDLIEARLTTGGAAVPELVEWCAPEDFAGLHLHKCVWLGGNLIEFRDADAAIVLPVAKHAAGPVASTQITVAFAMLPQSRSQLAVPMPPAPGHARISGRLLEEFKTGGASAVFAGATRLALREIANRR